MWPSNIYSCSVITRYVGDKRMKRKTEGRNMESPYMDTITKRGLGKIFIVKNAPFIKELCIFVGLIKLQKSSEHFLTNFSPPIELETWEKKLLVRSQSLERCCTLFFAMIDFHERRLMLGYFGSFPKVRYGNDGWQWWWLRDQHTVEIERNELKSKNKRQQQEITKRRFIQRIWV